MVRVPAAVGRYPCMAHMGSRVQHWELWKLTLRTNQSSPVSFAIIRKAIIATNSY